MNVPQIGIFAQGTIAHEFVELDLRPDVDLATATAALSRLRAPAVSAGGLWKTPKPRAGISTPLFSVMCGWRVVLVMARPLCAQSFVATLRARSVPAQPVSLRLLPQQPRERQ